MNKFILVSATLGLVANIIREWIAFFNQDWTNVNSYSNTAFIFLFVIFVCALSHVSRHAK